MALILPRSCFLHIPKCGGNTVRRCIEAAGIPHHESGDDCESRSIRAHHGVREVADELGDRLVFALIREPAAWYRSFWCYRMLRRKQGIPIRYRMAPDDLMRKRFDAWVEAMCERMPGYLGSLYRQMLDHPPVTVHVGATDRLTEHLTDALHRAGEQFAPAVIRQVPAQNEAGRLESMQGRARLTPRLRRLIAESEPDATLRYHAASE